MSFPLESSYQSAGSKVFHLPELVSLIARDLTPAELAQAARITKAAAAESIRLLYRSPAIPGFQKGDNRLAVLTQRLKRRPGQAERFSLGCAPGAFPAKRGLDSLFKQFGKVSALSLTGLDSASVPLVADAFYSVALQLNRLTLSFDQFDRSSTRDLLQLLRACHNLRHLSLTNLDLDGFVGQIKPPSYKLASLSVYEIDLSRDTSDLMWLLGRSSSTLSSLTSDSLTALGCKEVLKLLPKLAHLGLNVSPNLDTNFRRTLVLAKLPRLSSLALVLDNDDWRLPEDDLAAVEGRMRGAIAGLDAVSRAKVTFERVGGLPGEGYSSEDGEVGEDAGDESDEDEDYVVGSGGKRVAL